MQPILISEVQKQKQKKVFVSLLFASVLLFFIYFFFFFLLCAPSVPGRNVDSFCILILFQFFMMIALMTIMTIMMIIACLFILCKYFIFDYFNLKAALCVALFELLSLSFPPPLFLSLGALF